MYLCFGHAKMKSSYKKFSKKERNKVTSRALFIACAVISPLSLGVFAYASYAEDQLFTNTSLNSPAFNEKNVGDYSVYSINNGNTPLTYSYSLSSIGVSRAANLDGDNSNLVAERQEITKSTVDKSAQECAGNGGLADVQEEVIKNAKTMAMTTFDLDKVFDYKKSGCFNALQDFPDLSLSIPSLGTIVSALQKTLQDYATRKVCNVVNSAVDQALSPISKKLDELNQSGQLDLTGKINKSLTKKYYEIDPELGRTSTKVASATTQYNILGQEANP